MEWEWTQTLDSQDGDVMESLGVSLLLEVEVNLAGAENHFSDLALVKSLGVLVFNDWLEGGSLAELLKG